jgi:Aldehyde dehydrogenase family
MTTARVKHYAMLIGGDDIDWPQHMTIIDPSDESVVATVARGDASHIDAAVTAAKDAFDGGAWSRITPAGTRSGYAANRRGRHRRCWGARRVGDGLQWGHDQASHRFSHRLCA